jgi:hypothetical protein
VQQEPQQVQGKEEALEDGGRVFEEQERVETWETWWRTKWRKKKGQKME